MHIEQHESIVFCYIQMADGVWIIDKEKDVLKYFVLSTEQLLPMMLLTGLLLAGVKFVGGDIYKRFQWASVFIGYISAV